MLYMWCVTLYAQWVFAQNMRWVPVALQRYRWVGDVVQDLLYE